MTPGMRGFLCTCNSHHRERDCIRDSYNLLNFYTDQLENCLEEVPVEGSDNLDSALADEVAELKKENTKFRFQALESGAKGVVFIKTTVILII